MELFDDYYQREWKKYNVGNILLEDDKLENYIGSDLSTAEFLKKGTDKKEIDEMTEEDFYDEVLYIVVRNIQDKKDVQTTEYSALKNVLGFLVFGTVFLPVIALLNIDVDENTKQIKTWLGYMVDDKKELNRLLLDLKNKIETYRRLCDNNEEIKRRFTSSYNSYKVLLESGELDDLYKEILSAEPKLDIDKKYTKLLKRN